MKKLDKKKAEQTLEALNTLGGLLADYGHKWGKKERLLYYRAFHWLTSFCGADSGA